MSEAEPEVWLNRRAQQTQIGRFFIMEFYNRITYWDFAHIPHIGRQIFQSVDFGTLINASRVCLSWKTFIDHDLLTCSGLTTAICSNQMGDDIQQQWTTILQNLKNKEDANEFLAILKIFWAFQKLSLIHI